MLTWRENTGKIKCYILIFNRANVDKTSTCTKQRDMTWTTTRQIDQYIVASFFLQYRYMGITRCIPNFFWLSEQKISDILVDENQINYYFEGGRFLQHSLLVFFYAIASTFFAPDWPLQVTHRLCFFIDFPLPHLPVSVFARQHIFRAERWVRCHSKLGQRSGPVCFGPSGSSFSRFVVQSWILTS